jgi:proteic killer suppression protein
MVMAIQSFFSTDTRTFFETGKISKKVGWQSVAKVAKRKLDMIHYANCLKDLKSPPGNQLETLYGNYAGYHSIRINDQWRIVFQWTVSGPTEVEITDYH